MREAIEQAIREVDGVAGLAGWKGMFLCQGVLSVVIGIGAGPHTDGQVLVLQDMLGINRDFKPKFVRRYWDGATELTALFDRYHEDVVEGRFPDASESYA